MGSGGEEARPGRGGPHGSGVGVLVEVFKSWSWGHLSYFSVRDVLCLKPPPLLVQLQRTSPDCVLCCVPGGAFTWAVPGCSREGGIARMHPPHALPQDCASGLQPHALQPSRLLCPWNSPGKNTGVSCPSLLQGIFLTQGLNPGLLHGRQILYCLSYQGGPSSPAPEVPTSSQACNFWISHFYPSSG